MKKKSFIKNKKKYKFKYKKKIVKKVEKKIDLKTKKYLIEQNKKKFFKFILLRNPYILIRKNYKLLFKNFFNNRNITPLVFKFLHLAYFKLNINKIYRPRLINKFDSYSKRLFKYNMSTFKNSRSTPHKYLFILMNKRGFFQKIFDLYNYQNQYANQLHQLYYFQKVKKAEFTKFSFCPRMFRLEIEDNLFTTHDALRPNEYRYIRKILHFFYPVTEIQFKETHIHGKPMKTKLPRRV